MRVSEWDQEHVCHKYECQVGVQVVFGTDVVDVKNSSHAEEAECDPVRERKIGAVSFVQVVATVHRKRG